MQMLKEKLRSLGEAVFVATDTEGEEVREFSVVSPLPVERVASIIRKLCRGNGVDEDRTNLYVVTTMGEVNEITFPGLGGEK